MGYPYSKYMCESKPDYRLHEKKSEHRRSLHQAAGLLQSSSPLLEYSSNVWDPYTQKNIKKLEMIQRRAARYALHRHCNTSSVTDMLQTLNWRSLESRRKDMCLCMMFKIDRGLVAISKDSRLRLKIKICLFGIADRLT